jgi:hypothetical protein
MEFAFAQPIVSRHAPYCARMSPNKLFDYLDGKLSTQEREELEARMANDSTLLRQLAIARKLRETMPGSGEVIGSLDSETSKSERGAIISRRVGLAFIVLVFVNVFIGLWFIFQKEKPSAKARDADMRRQVEQSLEKAAVSAMPTPNIEADEIKISAPAQEQKNVANKVISAATAVGGTGGEALSDENGIIVLVDIPKNRETDFRHQLVALGGLPPVAVEQNASKPNERKFLQVRVVKAAQ